MNVQLNWKWKQTWFFTCSQQHIHLQSNTEATGVSSRTDPAPKSHLLLSCLYLNKQTKKKLLLGRFQVVSVWWGWVESNWMRQKKKKLSKFESLKFRFGTTRECSGSILYFGSEEGKWQNQDTWLDSEEERWETGGRSEERGREDGGKNNLFSPVILIRKRLQISGTVTLTAATQILV